MMFPKPSRVRSTDNLRSYAARHRWCEVIGCNNAPAKTPHHILERGNGGGDEDSNLLRLCPEHHLLGPEAWHTLEARRWYALFRTRLSPVNRLKVERRLKKLG